MPAGTMRTGGLAKNFGHGLVYFEGSFAIAASAISAKRTKKGGFTLTRNAAGVYLVTIDYNALEVVNSWAQVVPSSSISGAISGNQPVPSTITGDFLTTNAAGTSWAADSTNRILTILVYNAGGTALADVPANYRLNFEITVATAKFDT